MLSANLTQTAILGRRLQLAYVVKNIDDAMAFWTNVLKVGPFVVIENSRGGREVVHRGRPTGVDFTIAFAYFR